MHGIVAKMKMAVGGVPPLKQRGRPAVSRKRNPAVDAAAGGGGRSTPIRCDDKRDKSRRQLRERLKRWLARALGLAVLAAIIQSRSPNSRRSAKWQIGPDGVEFLLDGSIKLHRSPKAHLSGSDPRVEFRPDGSVHLTPDAKSFVCGRKMPFSLFDATKWPTKSVSLKTDDRFREVILLEKGKLIGDLGARLDSFFNAYEFAHDENLPLYVAHDSWAIDALSPLFFGPATAVERDAQFWGIVQDVLDVKVVKNEASLDSFGVEVRQYVSPRDLLTYSSQHSNRGEIENHRKTILRKLFRYPSHHGVRNACAAYESLHGTDFSKKYTVMHVAGPKRKNDTTTTNKNALKGRDSMDVDRAKGILKPLGMLERDVYLINSSSGVYSDNIGQVAHAAAGSQLNVVDLPQQFRHEGSYFYLAVLSDVYLGDPADRTSAWIARMRDALGMRNTFVFPEKGKNTGGHLELDDDAKKKLSRPIGIGLF